MNSMELTNDELEMIADMLREYKAALNKDEITSMGYASAAESAEVDKLINKIDRLRL